MKLDEKSLWQSIKAKDFLPVYLIKGNEGYLKQKYATLLADSIIPVGLDAFNFHKLKGEDTNPEEIALCVEALPAMCERTCVFVHDFDFDGAKENEREQLVSLLSDLPETCVLIFWQDTKGFSTKTNIAKEILSLIDKNGAVCTIDRRSHQSLQKFIVTECQKRERQIDYSTAEYFLDCVGDDMGMLVNEIDKICSYSEQIITKNDIDVIAVKSVEATAFKMIDKLGANNFDGVFNDMSVLFDLRTEPTMILGALISTYTDMYRTKVAKATGHSNSELKSAFPVTYKNDFRLRNASSRANKYSLPAIKHCLDVLYSADEKLKNSYEDKRLTIEKLVIELAKARAK